MATSSPCPRLPCPPPHVCSASRPRTPGPRSGRRPAARCLLQPAAWTRSGLLGAAVGVRWCGHGCGWRCVLWAGGLHHAAALRSTEVSVRDRTRSQAQARHRRAPSRNSTRSARAGRLPSRTTSTSVKYPGRGPGEPWAADLGNSKIPDRAKQNQGQNLTKHYESWLTRAVKSLRALALAGLRCRVFDPRCKVPDLPTGPGRWCAHCCRQERDRPAPGLLARRHRRAGGGGPVVDLDAIHGRHGEDPPHPEQQLLWGKAG